MSSNTKRRKGKGRGKSCPKCAEESTHPIKDQEIHNSAEWYTKEYIPLIGANYNILSNVGIEDRLLGNGMQLNVGVVHQTVFSIPIDDDFSALKQMALLWEDLREMNSGGINYSMKDLAAYAFNVLTLRGLCYHLHRAFGALRHKSPLMRDSPQIYANMCGIGNYLANVATYAADMNRASFLLHDIEQLPIVPFTYMDRVKFIYGTLFADSPTTRPAMVSFVPAVYFTYDVDTNGDLISTKTTADGFGRTGSISGYLTNIQNLLNLILNNPKYAVIRGDMLKAFGAKCLRGDLVDGLVQPLRFGYNEDVACQLENATLIGTALSSTISHTMVQTGTNLSIVLNMSGDSTHTVDSFKNTNHLINFHGEMAPRNGDLLALTRLVTVGSVDSDNNITVTSSSGIIIADTTFIVDSQMGSNPTAVQFSNLKLDAFSSIQSTAIAAYQKLMSYVSLVDRFPMVIMDNNESSAFMFDVDNFTILDNNTLEDMTQVANRSLLASRIPRGDNASIRKYGSLTK